MTASFFANTDLLASMASPADTVRWAAVVVAFVAAGGAFAHWGALSTVPSQAAAVGSTRVILAVLAASAGAVAIVARRERRLLWASALLLVLVFSLAWTEWRYEAMQEWQNGLVTQPWGLWLVMGASVAGAVLTVLAFVLGRGDRSPATA